MIFALLAPAPWMSLAAGKPLDTPITASVSYTYYTPAFEPPAIRIGDECFVPARLASRMGWRVSANKVTIAGKEIETFVRDVGGEKYLPVRAIVAQADAVSEWDATNDLHIYSKINAINVAEGNLEIQATLNTKKTVFVVDNPYRIVIDVTGARLGERMCASDSVRYSQFDKGTVRVVAQFDKRPILVPEVTADGPTLRVAWKGARLVKLTPLEAGTSQTNTEPKAIPVSLPKTAAFSVGKIILEKDTLKETILRIPIRGAAPLRPITVRDKEGVYHIQLPNSARAGDVAQAPIEGEVLRSVVLADNPRGGLTLDMELKQPMGVKIAPSANELLVRLVAPRNAGGTMSSKNIVVDAGHGAYDSGAQAMQGRERINEKDLALAIAKLVSDALSDAGSTVAMTRDDDAFIQLPNRPLVANNSNADFFLSIHINSNQTGMRSGTTTYYHFNDEDSRMLAQSIQSEIVKVSGIGDYGAVSDSTVAPTKGFSVLRNSKVPAVLIEVAYINNPLDRKLLLTQGFRKKIADAIVRGIKVYIGDQKG